MTASGWNSCAATSDPRVESFNGRLRQECLDAHWFLSLDDAKAKIAAWRTEYNESRPHSALDWATPAEFARRCRLQPATAISVKPEVPTSERYRIGSRVRVLLKVRMFESSPQ
jgi:putative transposase